MGYSYTPGEGWTGAPAPAPATQTVVINGPHEDYARAVASVLNRAAPVLVPEHVAAFADEPSCCPPPAAAPEPKPDPPAPDLPSAKPRKRKSSA